MMSDAIANANPERPEIFARFRERTILGESGRLLYSLLAAFATSGYRVRLFDDIPPSELGKYGAMARSLQNLEVTTRIPAATSGMLYLFDKEDPAAAGCPWRSRIQVKFDLFSPYWFDDPVIMPYPMHPLNAGEGLRERLLACRHASRTMGIFFAGDTKGYTRNRIRYPSAKLPRLAIVQTILERLGDRLALVHDEAALSRVRARGQRLDAFVMADPAGFRVASAEWLETISAADFFLCPPGYVMPMCHNAVEAMAVGTIPIINYPEWFKPALQDMETCITFAGPDDLIDKINLALRLGRNEVAAMRQRVIAYYERHLTAESFVRNVESREQPRTVVLVTTESNTARNASKLNRHSILVREGAPFWVRALAPAVRSLRA